ncbi:MAG TPA: hypothetical protein PLG15_02095 [Candidatus Gastranaerophilaceae bacterium]|nr:hypothetical protein [Candidatus Gastranaerophilaceae bacterium]
MKKTGLTLTEILLSFGIIGILAAIILPVLQSTRPEPNVVMFKKAHKIFVKNVFDLINNETYYPSNKTGLTAGNLLKPRGFNYTDLEGLPDKTDKFCYLFSQKINNLNEVRCKSPGNGYFTTTDGIYWEMKLPFDFPMSVNGYEQVMVDVNGPQNPPNCEESYCKKGIVPDKYPLYVRYDGKMKTSLLGGVITINPTIQTKKVLTITPQPDTPEVEPTPPDTCTPKGNIKVGNLCVSPTNIIYVPVSYPPYNDKDNYWKGADNACRAYGMRLPTKAELQDMYKQRKEIGNMNPGWYWSGEEISSDENPTGPPSTWDYAGAYDFTNKGGNVVNGKHDQGGRARCVLQWNGAGYY